MGSETGSGQGGDGLFDSRRELAAHWRRLGACIGTGLGAGAAVGSALDVLPVGIVGGLAAGFVVVILWDRRSHPSGR